MNALQLIALGAMILLAGAALLVAALRPAPPQLGTIMAQLNAQPTRRTAAPSGSASTWAPAGLTAFAERHLGAAEADLVILGRARSELAVTKIGWAAGGALLPPVFGVILAAGGIHPPWAIPAVASLVLAVLAWVNPSRQVAEDAATARTQFRAALAAFLALVGLERKARGSPAAALEEASRVSGSRPFRLIHSEVLRAELAAQLPWDCLLYTSDAADDLLCVDLGGRRIIKKKKKKKMI